MADELGPDDFAALYQMSMSDDKASRAQARQLAEKLTADEAQRFFDFQHAQHGNNPELHREDNSLLGMPPELAAVSAVGVGGAVLKASASGASKLAAGTKAAAVAAAPQLKYEMTKSTLQAFGVPGPLAAVAAMAVSSYKGGEKAVPAAAGDADLASRVNRTLSRTPAQITDEAIAAGRAEGAARVAPQAAAEVAPAVAAPVAPKVLNELALAARRNKIGLSKNDYDVLIPKVQAGASPADAVAELVAAKNPAARLSSLLGTPTDEQMASDMAMRYANGSKSLAP